METVINSNLETIERFMSEVIQTDGYDAVDLAMEAMTEFHMPKDRVPPELIKLARKVIRTR